MSLVLINTAIIYEYIHIYIYFHTITILQYSGIFPILIFCNINLHRIRLKLGCPGSLMCLYEPTIHVTSVDLCIKFQCNLYTSCIMACGNKIVINVVCNKLANNVELNLKNFNNINDFKHLTDIQGGT